MAYEGSDRIQLEQIALDGLDLAHELPDDTLNRISQRCVEAYERDKAEREEWESDYDKAAALVRGDRTAKTWPWPDASNVKYPLIMTAAMQFNARAYPAIVKGKEVVKPRVVGEDPDGVKFERGERISEHMNWQLTEDMPEWEDETDKLLMMLPWAGCVFRQVIWDETNARPFSSLHSARNIIVTQGAKDLETVPLFTKEFKLFPHEITERMRDGRYRELELTWEGEKETPQEQQMLECHTRYDLDEDGYDEPWIAVIHKESGKLLSLKAGFWPRGVVRNAEGRVTRVKRDREFIKYDFMPDPEGGFLGIGFGFLLREHNEVINTIINQLLDAGTDQNAGGGFLGRGVDLRGGSLYFEPGEWKTINVPGGVLKDNIVPRPTTEPSNVLFQLLGVMVEAGKEVASIRDVLSGENQNANQPATTTLAIIEQGLQVFSAIYKRIYRSLTAEIQRVFSLNGAYLPDEAYYYVLDDQKAVARHDYAAGDNDVVPVADPSVTTKAQKLAQAEYLRGFLGMPGVRNDEIIRQMLEAGDIDNIEKILPPPQIDPQTGQPVPPPPPPEVQAEMAKMELEKQKAAQNTQIEQAKAMHKANLDAQTAQTQAQLAREKAAADIQATRERAALELQVTRERAAEELRLSRDRAAAEMELAREKMANEFQLAREKMATEAQLAAYKIDNEPDLPDNRPGGDLSK